MRSTRNGLRVAMFTELTRKNGSSRVLCYQYGPVLARLGVTVRYFPPSPLFLYELLCERVTSPRWLVLLLKALYWYAFVLPFRVMQIALAPIYDVVLIERGLLRHNSAPALEWLLWLWAKRLFGRPLVYALDDAQYQVANPRYFQARFRMVDCVTTGNEAIAAYAREFNASVRVFEAAVDTTVVMSREHFEHSPVILGWVGTLLDSTGYLGLMREVLPQLSRRIPVILEVVSNRPFDAGAAGEVKNLRWTLDEESEHLRRFDIGIMPLPDNEFTRAKEGYKLKQYMAAGIPVVCSPVGQNQKLVQDGVNGFFARDAGEWVEKLALLAGEWQIRARMGRAGRRFVAEQYSLEVVAPRFAQILWDVRRKAARPAKEHAATCEPRGGRG